MITATPAHAATPQQQAIQSRLTRPAGIKANVLGQAPGLAVSPPLRMSRLYQSAESTSAPPAPCQRRPRDATAWTAVPWVPGTHAGSLHEVPGSQAGLPWQHLG